ncbi:MAG: undecaprenyl-diphosphatase UppP [Candidatus Moranbacteria bacterium]|nr:undecaprenyl-diphosphatase UppP [Candidatus Moranbacteria bacterium]
MLHFIQPVVFGLVQGIGEFLPISSTAHLILLPAFTGWEDPGLSFDVALHLGTLIAVVAFFWKDWLEILSSAWAGFKKEGGSSFKKETLYFLIVATVPAVIFGLLFEKKAETIFRSLPLIAVTLIVAGAVLYWADKKSKGQKDVTGITWKDAIIIGLSQALAIIPGFSRSGTTITAGLFCGLNKINAARFSFLLSTPIIAGAAILKLPDLIKGGINSTIIIAILSSAFFGYLAIKYLLKFLEKFGYGIFFWYRLMLGMIVLLVYYFK